MADQKDPAAALTIQQVSQGPHMPFQFAGDIVAFADPAGLRLVQLIEANHGGLRDHVNEVADLQANVLSSVII